MTKLNYRPKYEKIIELLLYLAHSIPGCDQYQAVKFFYLADSIHFNRYRRPLSYETYYAMDYGPVASTVLNILKGRTQTLNACEIAVEELPFEVSAFDKGSKLTIGNPKRGVNHELFSKSDIEVFDEVIKTYGNYTFGELYDLTHAHFAYRNVWEGSTEKRKLMNYEDFLDETPDKAAIINDLEPVAEHV